MLGSPHDALRAPRIPVKVTRNDQRVDLVQGGAVAFQVRLSTETEVE